MSAKFFVDLVLGYRSAKIVFVAHGLGLFAALAERPQSAAELAATLGTDARATELLVGALAALGLLASNGDRLTNTPLADAHLLPGAPGYLGENLAYQELLWSGWSELGEIVKTGRPPAGLVELLGRSDFIVDYLKSVDRLSRGPAEMIWRLMAPGPHARLLDVGGGLGGYARAFVAGGPERTATVVDLEQTLALTRRECAGEPRIGFVAGDYGTVDFGAGYDVALFSHVTHDESPESCAHLFRKAWTALAPGGRVAVHDFVVDDDRCGPLFATLFSVNMLVYTRGGRVYSVAEYRAALSQAGFSSITAARVTPPDSPSPSWLITGTK